MSSPSNPRANDQGASSTSSSSASPIPDSVFLVPYPKIIFFYPTFLVALVAGIWMHFHPSEHMQSVIGTIFLELFAVNLVILAFDFPRTTSLTLFFFAAAVVMGLVLLFTFNKELWPALTGFLHKFKPVANATFYYSITVILGAMFIAMKIIVRFDYWEVRGNELLHHHGFLANLERLPAANLRMEKEINDIFEYMLLRSGRLIIYTSNDRQPIVLDNVPFVDGKEEAVTRMLGSLRVNVRTDSGK